jgi:hypothetical protein
MPQPRSSQARPRRGSQGAVSTPDEPPPRRYSAARVRKAIIQVLAPGEPLTAGQIQRRVGSILKDAERASVKHQIDVLREKGDIERGGKGSRKFVLSDSGKRWWEGIEALSPAPVDLEAERQRRAARG